MKTYNNEIHLSGQDISSPKTFSREELEIRQVLAREKYRLQSQDHIQPLSREAKKLEIKFNNLSPAQKRTLYALNDRTPEKHAQTVTQRELAKVADCSREWMCISIVPTLIHTGFLQVLKPNKGKPVYVGKNELGKDEFKTSPFIYIVTPLWRWSTSVKFFAAIVRQAEKIHQELTHIINMINKYNKYGKKKEVLPGWKRCDFKTMLQKAGGFSRLGELLV